MTPRELRATGSLAAIFAMRLLGLFMIYPVFAAYARHLPGATPAMIGLALGAYGLTQGVLQIPFGLLSDRIGRKTVISAGLVLFGVGSAVAALATSIEGVLLGRILQGTGAVGSAILALVADLTREEVRTRAMAMIGMTIGFSFVIAIVLGPLLAGAIGVPGIFWLTAGLAAIGIGIAQGVVPTPAAILRHRDAEPVLALLREGKPARAFRPSAEQVPVREQEGLTHGFLALRGMDGKKLADGEMTEIATKDHVTSKTTFRFYDGSLYEDTTVFTQNGRFRVLSDDLVEKGPSFKQAIETSLNTATGKVVVRYDDGGRQKTIEQKLALPEDLANGVVFTIIKDIAPNAPETTVTMLVATPRPQLVKLVITPESHSKFTSGSFRHQAAVFDVKVQIGGITGWVAKVTGKQPPDTHVWVLTGAAPSLS
jgi:hypothetical protein